MERLSELTESPSLDPFEDSGESHFAPLSADDVALDMDSIEGASGYTSTDEAEDESDDDLDESDVETPELTKISLSLL